MSRILSFIALALLFLSSYAEAQERKVDPKRARKSG